MIGAKGEKVQGCERYGTVGAVSEITSDQADAIVSRFDEMEARGRGVREICICGHSTLRHGTESGSGCEFDYCRCREPRAVLRVENAQPFICKSTDTGSGHALKRGLARALKRGQKVELVDGEPLCGSCGEVVDIADENMTISLGRGGAEWFNHCARS